MTYSFGQNGHDGQPRSTPTHKSRHREIPLTKGKVAIVDDADFHKVAPFKWSAQKSGKRWYAVRGVRKNGRWTTQGMHRFLLNPAHGIDVDHANGDGLDNRRANLREATRSQNMANMEARGATRSRNGRWSARIVRSGETISLGTFDTEAEATAAYQAASRLIDGKFSRYAPNIGLIGRSKRREW